jgi:hypothetical protein
MMDYQYIDKRDNQVPFRMYIMNTGHFLFIYILYRGLHQSGWRSMMPRLGCQEQLQSEVVFSSQYYATVLWKVHDSSQPHQTTLYCNIRNRWDI